MLTKKIEKQLRKAFNIRSESILHRKQRWDTVGDYFDTLKGCEFRVSSMKDPRYEYLILIHEIIEKFLLDCKGVKEPDVMAFDVQYEKERQAGKHEYWEEPGDEPKAPYHREHRMAETVESMLAGYLDISWKQYGDEVLRVSETRGRLKK